ncbi:hypothetical protein [Deinococcus peraridilitoris]|uniref:DUF4468 domain-containing protein n=1 Tax=Deinococcus peraridilitoris (strain DSM 19664 / LMG 22246 / CIP 109416 / KR-200) TaxID=937777 RepID=K9ZXV0_DEIPD|nr:hypothetical protein [Deinococcus peraridilitoris]AFZ66426.1 hypothetical protein Deipe_0853 [Deinococcus peraridilitoris DSM 19664]
MSRLFLFLTALALSGLTGAHADHLNANLRDLSPQDVCAPEAHVSLEDEADDDLTELVQHALDRFVAANNVQWGDRKTCRVEQHLIIAAYEDSHGFVYSLEYLLEFRGDVNIEHDGKRFAVKAPRIWSTSYYGTYGTGLEDIATREARDAFMKFVGAWRSAHRR